MGRHHAPGATPAATPRGRTYLRYALAIGLVALLVAGLVAIFGGKVVSCGEKSTFTVMADPALVPAVRAEAKAVTDKCTSFTVREVPDAQVAGHLTGGGEVSDLWLAPSHTRVAAVSAQLGRDLPTTEVASSPIVLAGASIPEPTSWLDALQAATIRAVPADSPYATAPVTAGVSEAQQPGANRQALTAALAQYAQAAKRVDDDPVRSAKAQGGVVVVPEYAYLAAKKDEPGVSAVVPKSGAPRDDLLLTVTAGGDRATAAKTGADTLAAAFASEKGIVALGEAGLRGKDLSPAPPDGIGKVAGLPEPNTDELTKAEQAYATLAVPLKALVVVDTSGSMNESAGDTTRIGMLASGFTKVVTQIPDANAVGLWTFSIGSATRPDWTEVVPTARLDARRGDKSQRQALLDGVNALPRKVGGATGLYDTTLAAYRRAVENFDPAYSNSLILLTDGSDEKPGGMSLDDLVAQLRTLVDPARPVNIHTVGISKDADLPALKRIADATGGTAQEADSEQQMLTDFVTAIAKRAK
ncbi:von Willebrand factor type A OS=Tsukamurella paurometabola (strain ATCC 8368 / DSM / CCUG 35730/ CIP 100753 / JCM 10117 / KCTC 9821 / NBRC 16120 / NCIMB 702349 / NCTC 13040) OX=521096 GN=Tpau_3360 PE=4 SV=1 [Tsukamurella paurometabola]|uniref:von Willebrand factor type A n=1 Tax=Tsukamurella paurometabola (strain ATCC 8368 / DSM 20162 / CCUG 35730 / CIP 100753 / JCM 10117 / KCTC 9821 / NBRC 16120 / NCIMB 702349 / NCTC 13040) TaxID=521096 RepID=D5UWE5_TSUPD|nr:VWA domain-containing protein [Tsukamurella paurometabola]ADG79944.1 von Willebrand factor type A [Tsukamurella paurometabola DSM 20162]SUP37756.1 von Willebrand factor type A domain [Tsukamurella paurometabola]